MKATAKFLVALLSLGLMLSGLRAPTAAGQSLTAGMTALHAVGQFGGGDSDSRKEAAKWLDQAREAMKNDRLDLAEDYISRADKLNVKYDSLFSRFVDTPAKARKDLEELRAKAKSSDARPSSRFTPVAETNNRTATPPSDPNAGRVGEEAINTLTDDGKAKASAALREGRAALQGGNVPAAIAAYQKAAAMNARFGPAEYSPESLAAELRQAGVDTSRFAPAVPLAATATPDQFAEKDGGNRLPSALNDNTNLQNSPYRDNVVSSPFDLDRKGTSRYIDDAANSLPQVPGGVNAAQAEHGHELLLAARQALAIGDLNQSMQLVGQAKEQGGNYQLHGDSPDNVEGLIRRASQFTSGPRRAEDQAAFARDLAQFMMDQSEQLLPYGDVATARQLAERAKGLPVAYRQFERTPDSLLAKINSQASAMPARGPGQLSPADNSQVSRLPTPSAPPSGAKQQAQRMIAEARMALDKGDLTTAERFAQQADSLGVPNNEFAASETQPWEVLLEVQKRKNRFSGYPVAQASANMPIDGQQGNYSVAQGIYRPANDDTRNAMAQAVQPSPAQPLESGGPLQESAGVNLYQQGLRALANQDRETALQLFREAWQFRDELDPVTLQQLKDKLTLMRPVNPGPLVNTPPATPLEEVDSRQEILRQKLVHEINNEVAQARKKLAQSPREAQQQLERLRTRVSQAEVDPAVRKQLLTNVDRGLSEVEQYIKQNQAEIELDETNDAILNDIQLSQEKKLEVQQKVAELVERFNDLIEERRYEEAEVIAKQVQELDSKSELAQTLIWKSRFIRRVMEMESIKAGKEEGFWQAMANAERSAIPFDDNRPYQFPDAKGWGDLTKSRMRLMNQAEHRLSAAELEIQKSLKKPVDVRFDQRPLAEVLDTLSQLSGVPIHLDQTGLAAEGVTSNTPVTIRLSQPISLESALALILEPLKLSYVIRNEVLKISSEQVRESNTYTKVYNVADLVIPIPNFLPGYDQGLAGALREAYKTVGYGLGSATPGGAMSSVPMMMAANEAGSLPANSSALAQFSQSGGIPGLASRNTASTSPFGGPGGLGGAALADFDTLIELITTTIAPDTWDLVGGPGAVQEFPGNLSLVISQTQEVHEQIADLLEQLRRLQDLQVTIEVRFITLNDNFFERIGVDFDFDIDDNVKFLPPDDAGPSAVIGLDPAGNPTADFDLQFTQDTFTGAVPQFGGFSATSAANFGFAILSDIEMFFVLQAASGDTRSNVLQAPKVTLFNGQQATVSDTSLRPFVTSVVPVVGDFAAAQAPVILVLSEGTNLSVQAVVSNDRRFVRLTLVPFFSQIGEVEEFTFDGRTTTRSGSNVIDPATGLPTGSKDDVEVTTEGTTVQLPTFSFTTVSTTVSVPDGGTVLLGGIKRLREGRVERGLPFASDIPYLNRLFKNVGIGRETNSLMMMVTPRIIIQEEEEEKLGIDITP